MEIIEKTRFDTRLSKEQKDFFEYAARLGGFRTLTEFIIFSAQEKANNIITEHNTILGSRKDEELFFEAIMNPPKPNVKLRNAALKFNEAISK